MEMVFDSLIFFFFLKHMFFDSLAETFENKNAILTIYLYYYLYHLSNKDGTHMSWRTLFLLERRYKWWYN